MPKQNLTQYTILGLLNLAPRTGYDIKQFVETTMSHFWNESYRWVYTTLEQLEAEGMATARAEDRGERERVVYRITKKGQKALQGWLAEPPALQKVRDELLLKLLLGQMAPARSGAKHLARHHEQMLQRHEELSEFERQLPQMDLGALKREHVALTLDLSRRVTAAHLRWCEEALKQLKPAPRRSKKKTTKRSRAK
ncbi:MAG: helix-turn-helix transcriptional regulator [Planctomycetota bacterium]|jgi:DNA-binding PadR family transcriptional regulator